MDGCSQHCTGGGNQNFPKKKKCKKAKRLSKEALQIAKKRKDTKRKGEKKRCKRQRKGKIYPFECRVPKSDKKAVLSYQCKDRGKQENWKD